jgi:hypothetical protein
MMTQAERERQVQEKWEALKKETLTPEARAMFRRAGVKLTKPATTVEGDRHRSSHVRAHGQRQRPRREGGRHLGRPHISQRK